MGCGVAEALTQRVDRLPSFTARRGAESGRKAEAKRTPASLSETSQSAPLDADVLDAIAEALATALVAEFLAENGADSDLTVDSPGGTNHG